jgi:hypothetical protein
MTQDFNKVVDSGKRQEFNTGSVRDTAEGKGTPHLLAGEALQRILNQSMPYDATISYLKQIETNLLEYGIVKQARTDGVNLLYTAGNLCLTYINKIESVPYSGAFRRLSKHYENGAKKYDKNNWRKGQPISRYYDSAMRHLWAEFDGKTDEDHAAAIFWNIVAMIQTKLDIAHGYLPKELDDYPFTVEEVFGKKNDKV